ncbi:penicillin acylase family protein [Alteromonas sp. ASW11-36]|uniref:Penicillin acylase family protein n=1 Tax=Alteromonas arenosi TaxID=3055817 RepID=A0ABT7SY52_9ALTE|nr:penicillin acylase family protein [Alteromonas sp. ASW11-36]MDM7861106.1 penicillin acylase family protein [Alteromonas sp. ASW11-36]
MIKRISIVLFTLVFLVLAGAYIALWLSLPNLDQQRLAPVTATTLLERDARGHTIVTAANGMDAAYATGFAHAQDRLFQMDLLRRSGAGEIAELFGSAALPLDQRARFHQFRQRAEMITSQLPDNHRELLAAYTQGVNDAVNEMSVLPFEYLFLRQSFKPWEMADSILVSFSMYMDLQHSQVSRDLTFTRIAARYGENMVDFLLLPSAYQAALDNSVVPQPLVIDIPQLTNIDNRDWAYRAIEEPIDIGSNNWAVSGSLTSTGAGMISDDMHLGLRVPPIWYRLSLNYQQEGQDVSLHGVSLPGSPGIIVGSNTHIAWGFTNANLDNTDWIELADDTPVTSIDEVIKTPDGEHIYTILMSEYGPVKTFNEQRYALRWTAHFDYAVNLNHTSLATAKTVAQAREITQSMGIPVQNFVVADNSGNVGWMPAGAVTARLTPSNIAIPQSAVSESWSFQAHDLPAVINPDSNRIWTANARVISTQQLERFGDGGYALGARGLQIRDRLYERETFSEDDFYAIQLDNEAQFLSRWHAILTRTLRQSPNEFKADLALLDNWQACSCPDSVGYTLVRKFRTEVINQLLAPIENHLHTEELTLRPVLRHVEPAINVILQQQPQLWLPEDYPNYQQFLVNMYRQSRGKLLAQYVDGDIDRLNELRWGFVNELRVQHPFSRVMPFLSGFLDMPSVPGFGDSYLPAVQNGTHGASQRLTVQPGFEHNAILTIPGGQSGHPLSPFYRLGFDDYTRAQDTPLLPGESAHKIEFSALN